MNDDMLSQEEINELLKSVGETDEGEDNQEPIDSVKEYETEETTETSIDSYLDAVEKDALGEIGNISFGSAATALSQLLNQKVIITAPVVSIIERQHLDEEFSIPYISVNVQYTEGVEGTNLLAIQTRDAAIIADLMLGGDGSNPSDDLGELHLSAVQEAMNQMMGSASTSMSTVFNKRIDISPPGIELLDVNEDQGIENIPEDDLLVKNSFRLKIGSLVDSNIMQIFTIPFAKQMVYELMNPVTEEPAAIHEEITQTGVNIEATGIEREKEKSPIHRDEPVADARESYSHTRSQPIHQQTESVPSKNVQPAAFSSFDQPTLNEAETKNLNMLFDIPLEVTVELGRTQHSIKDILEFSPGSIIELDKLAGEPVDILINQKLTARGEVVVIDENFGVRITDIVSQADRLRKLK
ncbi:flagellar motor switch phosphatase FliY [Alteribacillus iranensis]|uniref:Flagellar motor switch protein FliN/FliY n=1 Tax=Alteribacillus iranensis TaxID=930128 RepID=A0A1I2A4I2_9BACI|nr:flagellar motor switch phosphatase FliY [Alteribacillus iranensis]SFE38841.1 flagellar motor switch protein FliN/FliY [Alteribacillus iranensis]